MEYKELPQEIKDWLGSEQITFLIADLNKRMGFVGWEEGVVASLIFDLATRALPPQNFTNELKKELEKDNNTINTIVREVKGRLLGPIEAVLRTKVAVDIQLISELQHSDRVDNVSPQKTDTNDIEKTEAPVTPSAEQSSKPFVIHQENNQPLTDPLSALDKSEKKDSEEAPNRVVHYSGPVTHVDHQE